jgi:hypothetical protein
LQTRHARTTWVLAQAAQFLQGIGQWLFSNTYFSIRPDPGLGLKPPVEQVTAPTAGSTFAGGNVVPITWTASAQQGLQSFDIQVSTDGGQTFHLITTGLGAEVRIFNWQLPASPGIPDRRHTLETLSTWSVENTFDS